MNTTRLQQLIDMYVYITKSSTNEAKKNILSTFTGQAIANNNPAYLYEQQTNNLIDIISELPLDIQNKFSIEKIINAMEHLKCPSMIKKNFVALPNYKQKNKKELLFLQQKNLIEISQNMILINKIKKVPKKISKYQLQLKLQKKQS
ncbi:hypothetical protein GXM21_12560 (plasmid) [Megamonas funiformis]|uniref:Uncharacterized protein n=1 Tax=Megamonas funiformis YIT 11815 TaxID=742816 RepID=A0ABP2NGH8_9FIRM|nr:hypothetical protein [Megamonas funiformis]EHR31826.1 hypothetical protein HMPREF9454_02482 [Megamonas funiformis YIT 11815]QIB61254.1 hypothetical protein GXM21_12560 [Megamonas funiformis]